MLTSPWRKSSYSFSTGNCIEVGAGQAVIGVRDTKDREAGPVLTFTGKAWRKFTEEVKDMGDA